MAVLYHILSLFTSRMAHGASNSAPTTWIIFDEAQRLFSQRYELSRGQSQPLLSELTTTVRSGGIGLCALAQSTFDLSRSILGAGLKLMGPLGAFQDYDDLGKSMGMDTAMRESAKSRLRPGVMIAQSVDLPYRQPFPFKAPLVDERCLKPDDTPTLSGLGASRADDAIRVDSTGCSGDASARSQQLEENELRFLSAVAQYPSRQSTFYAKSCRLGSRKAIEIRRYLVSDGYLREHIVQTAPRGGRSILLELTLLARRALAARGKEDNR